MLIIRKPLIILLLFSVSFQIESCKTTITENIKEEVKTEKEFVFPSISNNFDKGEYIDTSGQISTTNYIVINTNSKQCSTLYYGFRYRKAYFRQISDSLPFSYTNNVKLFIDSSQEFTTKYREYKMYTPKEYDEQGNVIFEYIPPYDSVISTPLFIVNDTDSVQMIENHDGKIIMIQEALNSKNEWQPIEYFSYSGCGNSYGVSLLDTNSYLIIGVNKYKGTYKTKLRVRLKTNGHIILSHEYPGYINKSQFNKNEENTFFCSYLKE